MKSVLQQSTLLIEKGLCPLSVGFVPELLQFHPNGSFNIVLDPLRSARTSIIGMFVLRPARTSFAPTSNGVGPALVSSIYDPHNWTYNVRGLDGGKLISNGSTVDAFRLALQYGLSDAVIVGSKLVSVDGVATQNSSGYVWQPYEVCNWGNLKNADPKLMHSIANQRFAMQKAEYLSDRSYPAQIMVTWSGAKKDAKHDFLSSRIFHEPLPNGKPMETYIVTTEMGAWRIRQRARDFNLHNRIDGMLITLPPPVASHIHSTAASTYAPSAMDAAVPPVGDEEMDISSLPKYLFDKLGILIANHDGGRDVLRAFARAGALSQLNLTLCQGKSLVDVLREGPYVRESGLPAESFADPNLGSRIQYFFDTATYRPTFAQHNVGCDSPHGGSDGSAHVARVASTRHSVPRSLQVVEVVQAQHEDVMVVTLKADHKFDF